MKIKIKRNSDLWFAACVIVYDLVLLLIRVFPLQNIFSCQGNMLHKQKFFRWVNVNFICEPMSRPTVHVAYKSLCTCMHASIKIVYALDFFLIEYSRKGFE